MAAHAITASVQHCHACSPVTLCTAARLSSLRPAPIPLSTVPQVYVSYGGLLMQLTGDPKRLEYLDIDQNIYLLMRKV